MEEIIDNRIPVDQKIRFYLFALDVFTDNKKNDYCFCCERLESFGFCAIYKHYFNTAYANLKLLPELLKYKPNTFYNFLGDITDDEFDFWFPAGKHEKRIEICKEILETLKTNNLK